MARALRPPVKRLERLLAQADRLASWTRAQGLPEPVEQADEEARLALASRS